MSDGMSDANRGVWGRGEKVESEKVESSAPTSSARVPEEREKDSLVVAAKRVLQAFRNGHNPTFDELDKLETLIVGYEFHYSRPTPTPELEDEVRVQLEAEIGIHWEGQLLCLDDLNWLAPGALTRKLWDELLKARILAHKGE